MRATGQRPPSQPTAWIWLEPAATSVYPVAGLHSGSILFQTPRLSVPPWTGMRLPLRTTNWCSPSGESSAIRAERSSATAAVRACAKPGDAVLSVWGVRTGSAAENGTCHSCAAGTWP